MDADVIVVGGGLAGLVATAELAVTGRTVLLLDQEGEQNLGGQAFWSLGGLFIVDTPEQRRVGVKDSHELAMQDWLGTATFDRGWTTRPGRTSGPGNGPPPTSTSPRGRCGPGCGPRAPAAVAGNVVLSRSAPSEVITAATCTSLWVSTPSTISSAALLSWSSETGSGMLDMVVCLLIATEWMAAAGPACAVRTVTVPC
jgi:hypothetical protein